MTTIKELENWMLENNMKNTFTPDARFVTDEGEGLEVISGLYIWYYIERGERQNLEYFKSEKDAVRFLYNYLIQNKS
ncbi:hypothetical protein GR160_16050 [Flavobacterium sp. Sd200]|uniref:hypothetical protein n=1 Tax=Flavobacterium sp. Sd200 TaxID=2692211 RepID=UPI00136A26DD|nr:hypothetical protein [Flavobacterium sp. Sd200]MXN92742.1 hypothetical protein [Flavobacterium sp. Sd200]